MTRAGRERAATEGTPFGIAVSLGLSLGSSSFAAIEKAETFVEKTGERFWEAEIHRLRGELLRIYGTGTSAEDCFQIALEVARRQGGRSLELRAAIGPASLWRDVGRSAEARTILSTVYDEFSGAFDTADLREAKSLLNSLQATYLAAFFESRTVNGII